MAVHCDYTRPAGFLYVLGLKLDLHTDRGFHPAEYLPTSLYVNSNQLTRELWEQLRDRYSARIHCTISGLLGALGIED